MELDLCLISKGYVCSGLQFEQLHFKTVSYLIVFQHLTVILWRGYMRRQIFNDRQQKNLLCMFMSVSIWCNLASTSLPSNYVSVKLRDDARNSSDDKLFQVHHPKSRNLGAVTVHFLLSTQISPVNCKRGSEERLCHSLTQLKCGHSLQEPIRDVYADTQTHFHIHLKSVPPELQPHMKILICGLQKRETSGSWAGRIIQKECGQTVGGDSPPLLLSWETPPGIVCTFLVSPA